MAMILIAEDEYLVAEMLTMTLEDAGHTVRYAHHGKAALKILNTEKIDLVISDFMMPLMTGLELGQALQASETFRHIPIILMSGAQGQDARSHTDLFTAILDKPFDIVELLVSVEAALQP